MYMDGQRCQNLNKILAKDDGHIKN
jgi:hypothetical protein